VANVPICPNLLRSYNLCYLDWILLREEEIMAQRVDTAKVADRRTLRFNTIDDLLQEMNRIEAAERSGKLKALGNWTAGQNFGHLAGWIDFGWNGYPMKPPPWFIRFLIKMRLKSYMRKGMPAGVKIPGIKGGTLAIDPLSTAEGAARLRKSLDRLKRGEPPKFNSPAFGNMSESDRVQLNLRHAELHLGFLKY
jgi:uncharacterized protein DUF1569